jgi:SAM-dependent MidA family methyltransferase
MNKPAPIDSKPSPPLWIREILEQHTQLRFDEFMRLALYDPTHGYYSQGERIFGTQGDFITAPEISPLFGQTLGHALKEAMDQCGKAVWEFGAGRGRLAADILNTVGDAVETYHIVDVSGALQAQQREWITHHAPEHAHKLRWETQLPECMKGVVIGNEVLDAMPVRLWRWVSGQVRELFVEYNSADDVLVFIEQAAEPTLAQKVSALHTAHGPWAEGYQSEWGQQGEAFVSTLTEKLHGLAVFIDYGFPQHEYYHPQRSTGTLVAHRSHQMHSDVLHSVGLQDLTAHIDFTSIYEAMAEQGGELLGYASQAGFLLQAGILDLLNQQESNASANTIKAAQTKHAVQTLLSEAEMGELFKVIVWCKGIEPDQWAISDLLRRCDRSQQI